MRASQRVYAGGDMATPLRSVRKRCSSSLRFFASSSMLPHPEKNGNGEDFCYITPCGTSVGVADGVGGWAEHGIDAGVYSRELCLNAAHRVSETGETNPRNVMQYAFDASYSTGTSTFCILTIQDDMLHAANLGDSGFAVFRPTPKGLRFLMQSQEQQHTFNCPRQIGSNSLDVPSDADTYEVPVKEGDIVIAGTDGLFDNVCVDDIIYALETLETPITQDEEMLTKVANHLATSAMLISRNTKVPTPFSRNAQDNGIKHQGGKMDDITVVVAVIGPQYDALTPLKDSNVSPNPANPFYLPPSAFTMEDEKENIPPNAFFNHQTPCRAPLGEEKDCWSPDSVYSSCSSATDMSF